MAILSMSQFRADGNAGGKPVPAYREPSRVFSGPGGGVSSTPRPTPMPSMGKASGGVSLSMPRTMGGGWSPQGGMSGMGGGVLGGNQMR